jgi:outer membrane protein TolC
MKARLVLALVVFGLWGKPAGAQGTRPGAPAASSASPAGVGGPSTAAAPLQGSFAGSVPPQPATADVVSLTLSGAIDRALHYNLGVITFEQDIQSARGARWRALAALLPTVDARLSETREEVSLAAFGFNPSILPGIPSVIGPFNVFDGRVYVSQPVLDMSGLNSLRRENRNHEAATWDSRNARDVVVLVAANLYLQALTASSRIGATRAQVDTAQTNLTLATDLQHAGLAASIDVVRAQVSLELQQQRLIAVGNDFQKAKLQLARAIGLPSSQRFDLADTIPYAAMPPLALEEALQRAYEARADYRAALARVQAAEADHRAAATATLPSVVVNADYGAIGLSPTHTQTTFTVAGAVRVPVFDGGIRRGRLLETEAALRERQAAAEDLRQQVESDIRTALLDVEATEAQLRVAQHVVDLAHTQLEQAQDRFRAGVTGNLEVIQAQEAVATSVDSQINSLYAHNVAKASLARAMGVAEETAKRVLTGSP